MAKITNGYPVRITWPQDVLARGAEAAFEAWHSHDAVVVATAVLNAAIRDSQQLDALVEAQQVKSQPIAKFRKKAVQGERPPDIQEKA